MPVRPTLYVPGDAAVDAESVNCVLHVAVQVAEENVAVTPTGKDVAANVTAAGLPVSSDAVMVSEVDCASTTDKLDDAGDNEKLVAGATPPDVVNV